MLLVAGGAGMWWSVSAQNSPNLDIQISFVVFPAIAATLAPWLLAVGMIAIVAVIFLHALR